MTKAKRLPATAVRIDAVLWCCCVSDRGGRMCGTVGEFRDHEPHDAIEKARASGWQFRGSSPRCPTCTAAARPFGRVTRVEGNNVK